MTIQGAVGFLIGEAIVCGLVFVAFVGRAWAALDKWERER